MRTTHVVIGGIFDRCDGEDENQRHDGGEPGKGGDLRDQLRREREAAGSSEKREKAMPRGPAPCLPFTQTLLSLTAFGFVSGKGSITGHIPAE